MIAAVFCARAADFPATLVSDEEADPIRSAIIRKEAWTEQAVHSLRADAERHMKEGPWSVTAARPIGADIDPHEYYSEAPYWWPNPSNPGGPYVRREGLVNPARFTANRVALASMCDTVFTLGTAAYLLEDTRYAQRAARIINTWFVNPRTRMNPGLDYAQAVPGLNGGRGTGIMEGRAFIRAIQGMEFLAQAEGWDAKDQAAVHKWFDEYLRWLIESKTALNERRGGNAQSSWWTAQVAAVATFVEDSGVEQMAFSYYRDRIFPRQLGRPGSVAAMRSRPLAATALHLEALSLVCRAAQVQGVDLWDLRGREGAGLGAVIDEVYPYLGDRHKWARDPSVDNPMDSLYWVAYAGMGLKRPDLIAAFRKFEQSDNSWTALTNLLVGRWEAAAHQTRH